MVARARIRRFHSLPGAAGRSWKRVLEAPVRAIRRGALTTFLYL